jgi:hypothetical protein
MKSFGKTIRTNDVKVKVFSNNDIYDLETKINEWLDSVSHEIVSIEFSSDNSYKRVLILYRV